jgi:hypothetical protein
MNWSKLALLIGMVFGFWSFDSTKAFAEEENQAGITGWVDGSEFAWIVKKDRLSPSAVFSNVTPGVYQFRIHAYENERFHRENSIYLELVVRDGELTSSQLLYFPFAPRYPRFSFGQDHGTGQLTLNSLEIKGDKAHISASYAGRLYYHQSQNTRPIEHRTRPMRINIELIADRD